MNITINIKCFEFFKNLFLIVLILLFITSCKKDSKTSDVIETGTVTDIEGTVYKTVKIGNQWWMAENLKTTKYCNGDSIQNITDTLNWHHMQSGAYCNYSNDTLNVKKYGHLYNWYAVTDSRSIAPVGWHVPSDNEWKALEEHLGMSQSDADKMNWRGTNEGNKLKTVGQNGWNASSDVYNVWGTNESGFSALAGGCRMFNGIWGNPALWSTGFWWSVSELNNEAWYRYLDYQKPNVFRFYGPKTYGFSIRCVKN